MPEKLSEVNAERRHLSVSGTRRVPLRRLPECLDSRHLPTSGFAMNRLLRSKRRLAFVKLSGARNTQFSMCTSRMRVVSSGPGPSQAVRSPFPPPEPKTLSRSSGSAGRGLRDSRPGHSRCPHADRRPRPALRPRRFGPPAQSTTHSSRPGEARARVQDKTCPVIRHRFRAHHANSCGVNRNLRRDKPKHFGNNVPSIESRPSRHIR